MFRKLFIISLILLTSLSLAQNERNLRAGGYARVYSMGMNPYIVDLDNIKTNPAYGGQFSNMIWGDIGSSAASPYDGTGQFAGFNYRINKMISVGALLTRNDFQSLSIGKLDPGGLVAAINSVPGVTVIPLDNNLELMGSFNFDKLTLGIGIAYASTNDETKPATGSGTKNNASQIGINAGLLFNLSSTMNIDAALSLIMPSASYEPASGSKVDASQTFIMFDARMFMKMTSKLSLVPVVNFMTASGSIEAGGTTTDMTSYSQIGVGVGMHYQVGDLLIAGGPSLLIKSYTSPAVPNSSPELTSSQLVFPNWNLGAEFWFTDWLIGRLGYMAHTEQNTSESMATLTTKNEHTYTSFGTPDVRVGIGLRFGGFSLDATVNDDVLRQGLNLIGGGTPTLAYISASYAIP
ncbi:MAG: hypothetical protein GX452_08020 [Ignavibacteriales bacterium]|nr:hypothetical protein [Ignavibacteriaceae bacterium]NLH61335.1 hypothetical protein [Ignavibacteriales bacterium]HOJ18627.1 hypothetical protein [Ignavibacteriaceae bacterium]